MNIVTFSGSAVHTQVNPAFTNRTGGDVIALVWGSVGLKPAKDSFIVGGKPAARGRNVRDEYSINLGKEADGRAMGAMWRIKNGGTIGIKVAQGASVSYTIQVHQVLPTS